MIALLLVLLLVLWFFGYLHIFSLPFLDISLFTINGQVITLANLLVFFLILAVISVLPNPLRAIAFVILILWVLATLGILAIGGLASLLVLGIIIGLILSLLGIV